MIHIQQGEDSQLRGARDLLPPFCTPLQNDIAFRFFSYTTFRSLNVEMAEKFKEIHILLFQLLIKRHKRYILILLFFRNYFFKWNGDYRIINDI